MVWWVELISIVGWFALVVILGEAGVVLRDEDDLTDESAPTVEQMGML